MRILGRKKVYLYRSTCYLPLVTIERCLGSSVSWRHPLGHPQHGSVFPVFKPNERNVFGGPPTPDAGIFHRSNAVLLLAWEGAPAFPHSRRVDVVFLFCSERERVF